VARGELSDWIASEGDWRGFMAFEVGKHYLEEARRQMRGQKRMGEGAIAQLRDEELFVTLDPESNSIAILVKHLAGNMRSRFTDFLTSDGEKPDRFRDREFEMNSALTRADVMRWWEEGWACVLAAIDALKPEDVMRTVAIRGEPTLCCRPSIARSPTMRDISDRSCFSPNICGPANGRHCLFRGGSQKNSRRRPRRFPNHN
jgi:hypothetical protein